MLSLRSALCVHDYTSTTMPVTPTSYETNRSMQASLNAQSTCQSSVVKLDDAQRRAVLIAISECSLHTEMQKDCKTGDLRSVTC